MATTNGTQGVVYLIHFDRPYQHTQHYIGWTGYELALRLYHHRIGRGARFLEVVSDAGIGYDVVRTWNADRHFERRLKNQKQAPRLCPICSPGNRREEENRNVSH